MVRTGITAASVGLALFVASAAVQPAAQAQTPERLVVSFTPEAAPLALELSAERLTDFLASELGIPVIARVDGDYTGTVEAMRSGLVDIAFLSPLGSAFAHELAGARTILAEERRGQPYYTTRFWVRRDSGIQELADLGGRSIAFNDPLSASGYLYPVAKLVEEGLIGSADDIESFFGRVYFAGGTELSLRALMNGFVDAAGVSAYGPEIFLSPEEQEELVAIAEHGPIPNHGIAASGALSDEMVVAVTDAFLRLNEPEHNEILRGVYGWQKLVAVDTEIYLPLIDLARDAGILSGSPGAQ